MEPEQFAQRLLGTVLQRLPQGLSVGVANRCLLAASPLVFLELAARDVGVQEPASPLEDLYYTVIVAIERHFMVGSFHHWPHPQSAHDRLINDPGETLVAMAPLLSRGQPLGVLFVLERIERLSSSADAGLVERLALEFCRWNAGAASEFIQRVREANFLRLCHQEVARLAPSEGTGAIFKHAIVPKLGAFLNIVSCRMCVGGQEEVMYDFRREAVNSPFALGGVEDIALAEQARLQVHSEKIWLNVGRGLAPIGLDMTLELLDRTGIQHRYEWISVLSEAYKHAESSQQGVQAAGAVLAKLVGHHADRDIYAGWSRAINRVVATLGDSTDSDSTEIAALRYVAWDCERHSHRMYEGMHKQLAAKGWQDASISIRSVVEVALAGVQFQLTSRLSRGSVEQLGSKILSTIRSRSTDFSELHVPGCRLCLEYALVEALTNAIKAVSLSSDIIGRLPETTVSVTGHLRPKTVELVIRNWHAFTEGTPRLALLERIASFLNENPIPKTIGPAFNSWRDRYVARMGRCPERPGGIAGEIGWSAAVHAGSLSIKVLKDAVELRIEIPRS